MLKVLPPNEKKFFNLKCGEIYCESPSNYKVDCCMCSKKLEFDVFPLHFHAEHLSQDDFTAWLLPTADGQDSKPVDIRISLDEAEIKNECEEVKPILFPIEEVEDEKPIDFKELQRGRSTFARKKIIVENLNVESYHSDSDTCNERCPEEIFMDIQEKERSEVDDTDNDSETFNDNAAKSSENDVGKKNTKQQNFLCSVCPTTFPTKRRLYSHMRSKHKEVYKPLRPPAQKLKCKECDEVFPNERSLTAHMYKHTGIFCDICGKTFSQAGNLKRHKIRHTGIKAYKCAECENSFFTDKELKAHMMRHTGIFPHICEICGRRCRDHGVLSAHMRRHTGERPAKCTVCGKCFYSIYDLNVHSVTHTTLRPFKCDVCGGTFQTKKALRVHKKLHSTERNHECKICTKKFIQSSGLSAHMRVHHPIEIEQGATITEQQGTLNFEFCSYARNTAAATLQHNMLPK